MQTPGWQVWKEPCPSDHISAFGCGWRMLISPHFRNRFRHEIPRCQACRRNFDLSFQESRPGRYLQKHTKTMGVPTIPIQTTSQTMSLSFFYIQAICVGNSFWTETCMLHVSFVCVSSCVVSGAFTHLPRCSTLVHFVYPSASVILTQAQRIWDTDSIGIVKRNRKHHNQPMSGAKFAAMFLWFIWFIWSPFFWICLKSCWHTVALRI